MSNTWASNKPMQYESNTHARNSNMKTRRIEPLGDKLREVVEYPPHQRGIVIVGKCIDDCACCGDRFGHSGKGLYCSNACKAKASRIRAGRASNRREAAQRSVSTKHRTGVKVVCECCGLTVNVNAASACLQLYCSNACKQKAYRQRKVTSMPVTGG